MRILHVVQPPRGGAPGVAMQLVTAQASTDVVGLVCRPGAPFISAARAAGATVWCLPMERSLAFRGDIASLIGLVRILRQFRPDIVHAHSSKAGMLTRLAAAVVDVPVVYSPHMFAYRLPDFGARAQHCLVLFERALAPLTARFHLTCFHERQEAIDRGVFRPEKGSVVYNGADIRDLLELGAPPDPPVIGTYARLRPQKRLDMLLRALAPLLSRNEARLVVFGDGPLRDELVSLANELGIQRQARFEPDPGSAASALAALSIYVSSSSDEGLPIGVIEAMAARRAIVATAVGGIPELIRDGETGLLTSPDDPAALAAAVESLLHDAALRDRLGSGARDEAAARFTSETMAREMRELYCDVLELAARHSRRRRASRSQRAVD